VTKKKTKKKGKQWINEIFVIMFSTVTMMMSASGGIVLKENSTGVQSSEDSQQKVKVSSIPLYPASEEYDYYVDPPSRTENVVRDVRISVEKVKDDCQPFFDKVSHIYNTGVAHTNESLISLRDEDHVLARIGFMTFGGAVGLISARRGRFLKKLSYTTIGIGGSGAVCYPQQAKNLASDGLGFTNKNLRIAYHFIVGSRPQVQNEDGKALKSIGAMTSDIGQWSLNLLKKLKPAPSADKATDKSETPEPKDNKELQKTEDLVGEKTVAQADLVLVEQVEESTSPIVEEVSETKVEKETEESKLETGAEAVEESPIVQLTEAVKSETVTDVVEELPIVQLTEAVQSETVAEVVEESPIVQLTEAVQSETVVEVVEESPVVPLTEAALSETVAEAIEESPVLPVAEAVTSEIVAEAVIQDVPIVTETEEVKPETVKEVVVEESAIEAVEEVPKVEAANEVKPSIEGDFGQGYAEDKIMYTTRE